MLLYTACGNIMVNVDQPHGLQTQTKKKADNVGICVVLWCGYVTTVDMGKQYVLHILCGFI